MSLTLLPAVETFSYWAALPMRVFNLVLLYPVLYCFVVVF